MAQTLLAARFRRNLQEPCR